MPCPAHTRAHTHTHARARADTAFPSRAPLPNRQLMRDKEVLFALPGTHAHTHTHTHTHARARADTAFPSPPPLPNRQLMRDKKVLFAGYRMPHPLEFKLEMRVQTADEGDGPPYTPQMAMDNAIQTLVSECSVIGDKLKVGGAADPIARFPSFVARFLSLQDWSGRVLLGCLVRLAHLA